ncbi:MAG: hypothetical protein KQH63_12245 [Desulfobulbaceae bacterium]|nr:hypothetical protein [Desulfobulbaceae bacterium]
MAFFYGVFIRLRINGKEYDYVYCRISRYLQTMASQGINPLVAIQMALADKFSGPDCNKGK